MASGMAHYGSGDTRIKGGERMPYAANARIEQWLQQENPEEVLEPELAIVDPHHHLWDIRPFSTQPYLGFQQKVYFVSESAGTLTIAVEAVPDEYGNIPVVGFPIALRIESRDGSADGRFCIATRVFPL